MKIFNQDYLKFSCKALLFLLASAGTSLYWEQGVKADEPKNDARGPLIVWEPNPRAISSGNSGQLEVLASESIYLLHAGINSNGKPNILFSRSHNIGDSFAHPQQINSDSDAVSSHGENGPQLKVGPGVEIYTAWEADGDIKFSRSISFGKHFSPGLRVNDDSGDHYQSFFTMEVAPNGAVYVAWLDGRDKKLNRPGTSSLYIARSTDRGATLGKNIRIAGDICPCCRPSIAFGDEGEIFIAWRHVFDNHERIVVVASSMDGGETWSQPVRVTPAGWKINGCAHSGPSMQFINGKLILAWYTGVQGKAVLRMARSTDNGKTFEDARDIHGEVLDPNHPHIARSHDEVLIIFQGRDPKIDGGWGPAKSWVTRISSEGQHTTPEALPSSGNGVVYPYLFVGTGGRVYATWTEFGDKGPQVVLCRGRIQTNL